MVSGYKEPENQCSQDAVKISSPKTLPFLLLPKKEAWNQTCSPSLFNKAF